MGPPFVRLMRTLKIWTHFTTDILQSKTQEKDGGWFPMNFMKSLYHYIIFHLELNLLDESLLVCIIEIHHSHSWLINSFIIFPSLLISSLPSGEEVGELSYNVMETLNCGLYLIILDAVKLSPRIQKICKTWNSKCILERKTKVRSWDHFAGNYKKKYWNILV